MTGRTMEQIAESMYGSAPATSTAAPAAPAVKPAHEGRHPLDLAEAMYPTPPARVARAAPSPQEQFAERFYAPAPTPPAKPRAGTLALGGDGNPYAAVAAPAPPPSAAPTAPKARTEAELAEAMFGKGTEVAEELPPEVKALRDSDLERRFFDDRTTYSEVLEPALKSMGFDEPGQAAELKAWSGVFADAGLETAAAGELLGLRNEAYPEPAVFEQWGTDAATALRAEYGDAADRALKDAQLLVKRDPRIGAFLDRTGLGNHPKVALHLAAAARAQIAAGKLKRS